MAKHVRFIVKIYSKDIMGNYSIIEYIGRSGFVTDERDAVPFATRDIAEYAGEQATTYRERYEIEIKEN